MKKKNKLPKSIANIPSGKIPEQVTHIRDQDRHYYLSFKFYNDNLCEIGILEKNRPKECIQVLKRIGQTPVGNLKEKNIDQIPIRNKGEYKKLYNNLDSQVEIYEHKIQGDSRLFYFIAAHEFNVVAITNSHFEINKVRR